MAAFLRNVLIVLALAVLATCGAPSKFKVYRGPAVTLIEVHKSDRKMYLLHGTTVLKAYDIRLGGNPVGQKQFEGDQKTPEGSYYITHRNPNSAYHLSIGISYPNQAQKDYAKSVNMLPGGDIFIHGGPPERTRTVDWTVGCIAISDKDMEDVYAMVNPGTLINIFP